MRIGQLADRTGFSRDTIRYYEKPGLLPARAHARRANKYRDYGQAAVVRLRHVNALKAHGFTLSEIREVLDRLEASRSCEGVPDVLREKLADVERDMERLDTYRHRLHEALAECGGSCCDEPAAPPDSARR